ncbi:MAG: hypothetical protein E7507_07290 [Ruminococcus sp.]|nr:hypothetical protein [Ruminococcus sp.]
MKTKRTLAMLLASMMVMSMATVSAFAYTCDSHNWSNGACTNTNPENDTETCDATHSGCDNAGATCTTPGTCSVCGAEGEIDPDGHAPGDTSANETHHWNVCDNGCGEHLNEVTHTFGEWSITKEASCTEEGSRKRVCSCGSEEIEAISMTAHNYVDGKCSSCGKDEPTTPEPNPEDTQIEEVIINMSIFEVGGTLPTVENDGGTGYTVDYVWTLDEEELDSDHIITEDLYVCTITITPEADYTLGELTVATLTDWKDVTMSVSNDIGTIIISLNKTPKDEPSSGSGSSSTPSNPSNTKAGIINAKKDEKITVTTTNNEVSKDYIAAAAKSKATLVVNYEGYTWEISDVKEAKGNINLSINKNAVSMVDVDALKDISGDSTNIIDIAHDGELGFKGTLKYNVKKENAGKFVNLYYYNPTTKKLELQGSTKIAEDGSVKLPFTHCSTYVLNITDKAVATTLFEDLAAGEAETTVEAALPSAPAATTVAAATDAAANPSTGNSAVALAVIPVAIMAAAVIAKKK